MDDVTALNIAPNIWHSPYYIRQVIRSFDMETCQCTQAGNSNRMETFAFAKVLNRLKNENIKIEMLATDRHS